MCEFIFLLINKRSPLISGHQKSEKINKRAPAYYRANTVYQQYLFFYIQNILKSILPHLMASAKHSPIMEDNDLQLDQDLVLAVQEFEEEKNSSDTNYSDKKVSDS